MLDKSDKSGGVGKSFTLLPIIQQWIETGRNITCVSCNAVIAGSPIPNYRAEHGYQHETVTKTIPKNLKITKGSTQTSRRDTGDIKNNCRQLLELVKSISPPIWRNEQEDMFKKFLRDVK